MKLRHFFIRHFFILSALLLLSDRVAIAQPGGDLARFSALDTCNEYYLGAPLVFLGRVASIEEIPNPYKSGLPLWKAIVTVETSLKGQLAEQVELTIVKYEPTKDWQIRNKKFIFTAQQIDNTDFSGLYSTMWSTAVDDVPPNVMAKVLDEIRAVLRGVPQPRIVGTVREQEWGISFDPVAGRPLSGLVVVAERKDGQKFRTQTDAAGRFQFDELPSGMYTISTMAAR